MLFRQQALSRYLRKLLGFSLIPTVAVAGATAIEDVRAEPITQSLSEGDVQTTNGGNLCEPIYALTKNHLGIPLIIEDSAGDPITDIRDLQFELRNESGVTQNVTDYVNDDSIPQQALTGALMPLNFQSIRDFERSSGQSLIPNHIKYLNCSVLTGRTSANADAQNPMTADFPSGTELVVRRGNEIIARGSVAGRRAPIMHSDYGLNRPTEARALYDTIDNNVADSSNLWFDWVFPISTIDDTLNADPQGCSSSQLGYCLEDTSDYYWYYKEPGDEARFLKCNLLTNATFRQFIVNQLGITNNQNYWNFAGSLCGNGVGFNSTEVTANTVVPPDTPYPQVYQTLAEMMYSQIYYHDAPLGLLTDTNLIVRDTQIMSGPPLDVASFGLKPAVRLRTTVVPAVTTTVAPTTTVKKRRVLPETGTDSNNIPVAIALLAGGAVLVVTRRRLIQQ